MRRIIATVFFGCIVGCSTTQKTPVSYITPQGILADVTWLASDELQGRYYRSQEAKLAARYIADKWKDVGLEALPFVHLQCIFRPMIRRLRQMSLRCCPEAVDEYVLMIAHYDHLKPKTHGKDRIYNGADDNASGTAALLSIATALSKVDTQLEASIVLVAFTGEEAGFVGSSYFVDHPPIPLQNIRGVINLDMISRGDANTIFLEGTPDAPDIARAIHHANKQIGLQIIRDKHPDWLRRGDQWVFLQKNVPSVFLSVEDHEDYHRVTDHVDRILPDLAAKTAQLAFLTAVDLAGGGVP